MHSAYRCCLPSPRQGCTGRLSCWSLQHGFIPLSIHFHPSPVFWNISTVGLHTLPHPALPRPFSVQCQVTFHQKESNHDNSITHLPHWSYNPNVIHSWKRHHLPFYPIPKQCPHCLQGSGHWPCPLLLDPLFSMGASTPTTWLVHCLSSFCNSGLRSHANFLKLWR